MNPNTIVSTGFLLPTAVIANGSVTGNEFSNPNNILLVDGDLASSNVGAGVASDITIGNFNTNLPQNAVVVGIEMQLIAKRGAQTSPQITLTPYLFDNTNGADDFYPYVTPFTGLTEDLDSYVLGTQTYLFASSFDVDQINNLKMNIVANGDVQIDSFLVNVYYYEQETGTPIVPTEGNCEDCNSVIQVPEMFLQLPFLVGETKFYLQPGSLQYANGQPVQPGDVGACGGEINFVFDEGKIKADGQNFEENVRLDVDTGSWQVLSNGVIEVNITDVENRGIEPYTPYGHNANLMSDHDANSKVIISNSARFYSRFVKRCEEGTTFSAPIEVLQEEAQIAYPVTKFNFKGNGVSAVQNGIDPEQVDITIAGDGTSTPVIDSVESVTSGSTQVDEFSWEHTCSGVNRYLLVQFSLEEGQSVSTLTYDGVAMSLIESQSGASNTRTEIWGLVAPSVGTNDIEVTFSGLTYFSGGSISSANVDQSTPIGDTNSATGTSLTPSVAITTDYDNSIIFDVVSTAQTPILLTPGAGQVSNWSEFANTDTRQGAGSYEIAGSSPDAITMSYSITQNTEWSISAIELKGITTGSTGSNLEIEEDGSSIDTAVTKINFTGSGVTVTQTAPGEVEVAINGGGSGSGSNYYVDQTPDNGTYGLLAGDVDGVNTTFTVSQSQYLSGSLVVYLNGIAQQQGASDDFQETDATTGEFEFNTAPVTGDIITVIYQTESFDGINVNNVTLLDDFITGIEITDDATDFIQSGNFLLESVASGFDMKTEANHPGIVSITGASKIVSLASVVSSNLSDSYLLSSSNSFKIEILSRLVYTGATFNVRWNLFSGTQLAGVSTTTSGFMAYRLPGGAVVPTATAVPASGDWFKITIQYDETSGDFTFKLNNTTLFTGAGAFSGDEIYFDFATQGTITGLTSFDTDYVKTNYKLNR